ncbi:MAG: hypothetical protein OEX81_02525, partial [Candidatus Pacebacteria bacterium]|nr:hypothetical protein [Candidatus Paceibacterota bacterium]
VPRSFLIRASLGEAISSGLHDLETNGPRWWRVWSDKDWDRLTMPYHVDLEGYSTSRFGDDWWEIYEEGIWKWKKYSVPFWQMLEYERQGQMLHYSRVHFFGNDYEASDLDYDASKIWDMLENQLLQRVTNLYEHAGCRLERIGPIFGRAWDYRHFANCIISNLEGKPYLYRHL